MRQRGSIMPGLILVVIGMFLLLDRMDVYYFEWSLFIPAGVFLLGLSIWTNCLKSRKGCNVFWGTVLVILGGFFFLWNYGTLDVTMIDYWPIFPTAIGAGFLSIFLLNWRHWWALFPGVPLLVIGGSYLAYYTGYIDLFRLEDILYTFEDIVINIGDYYPVIFIVIGLLLIVMATRRSRRKVEPPAEYVD